MTAIPFADLSSQNQEIAEEIEAGFASLISGSQFVLGPQVAEFEEEFASHVGTRSCVGVGSGTDAIEFMLRALAIGPGDEVILPAHTFIATALAVVRAGAHPIFVDVDPDHFLIDVEQTAAKLSDNTRAVIAVHLYGQIAPMEALKDITANTDVVLLEDAAQAHGATRHGRRAGSFGEAAAFSFYPSKNLGAFGDAGAVLTNDDNIAAGVRRLRNWGSERKYYHEEIGFNSRLDSMQAVVLRAKLRHLDAWNTDRQLAASRYDDLLAEIPQIVIPKTMDGNEHVWHLYVVQTPRRDHARNVLKAHGIDAGIHYPVPIHLQGAFRELGIGEGAFPISEHVASCCLSLPMFPGITFDQQVRVAEAIRSALD